MKTLSSRLAAALDLIVADANAYIDIYSGSVPDDVEDSETGTLLAHCPFDTGADWGAAVAAGNNESATTTCAVGSNDIIAEDADIDATGTAGYFRIYDDEDNAILQGTCGTSGADLILSTTSLVENGVLTITAFAITLSYGS